MNKKLKKFDEKIVDMFLVRKGGVNEGFIKKQTENTKIWISKPSYLYYRLHYKNNGDMWIMSFGEMDFRIENGDLYIDLLNGYYKLIKIVE